MKKIILSCTYLMFLFFTSCDWVIDLYVKNESSNDIIVFIKEKYNLDEDTLLSINNSYPYYKEYQKISPQETSDIWGEMNGCKSWKQYYKHHNIKDYLYLFVLAADTLAKYSWAEIRERNLILVRYDLTYKDIELFSPLYYPPTPEMRDIKMWPPYSTFEK